MDKEYIERGYLIKEAENILIYRMQSCMSHERIEDAVSTLEWLKYHAPAADVMEVRHGRWIDKGWNGDESWHIDGRGSCWRVHECSECKAQQKGETTSYCPNCGAKMDL